MNIYELTYITSPELTREETEAVAKEIESYIQENSGVILRRENPVAKTLAYPIKNQSSGFFNILDFQLQPEKLSELKEKIEKNVKIIRHMLVVKNPERKLKARRERKKFGFITKTDTSKTESLGKEEFSFTSPFASDLSGNPKDKNTAEDNLGKEKTASNPEDKPEKIELKDIEEKLDEILSE